MQSKKLCRYASAFLLTGFLHSFNRKGVARVKIFFRPSVKPTFVPPVKPVSLCPLVTGFQASGNKTAYCAPRNSFWQRGLRVPGGVLNFDVG